MRLTARLAATVTVLVAAALIVGCGGGAPAPLPKEQSQSQSPAPARPFAATSFWNQEIPASAKPDGASSQLVHGLVAQVARFGPWMNTTEFSAPVYRVGGDVPTTDVKLDRYNPDLQAAFRGVPLPADAKPGGGTDAQVVVWQPSTDKMWEFWKLRKDGGQWHARWGGRMDAVSKNPGFFTKPHADWGATGTSLPQLGGLVRLGELRAGRIDHALALAVPRVRKGAPVFPAQRSDGDYTSAEAIPEGTRFRLSPDVDVDSLKLPPLVAMLARAAQKYGIVVRDQSGAVAFEGEDPAPLQGDPYAEFFAGQSRGSLLKRFPWSRLEVVPVPRS